jgi:predicted nucleotidyltransferase component of viral defense system
LSDEAPINLRAVADYFGLPGTASVEKDLHVVRAIHAVTFIDANPFTLVFGGGTALARAHKIVRRMSEDVDFKIVPRPATPVSRNGLRRALGKLGDQVTQSLLDAGFQFDPKDNACKHSQNENRYTVWQIPYDSVSGAGQGLRPTIQIELTYASLRLPAVTLPLSSFLAEAYQRPPEMPAMPCVSVTQTAAEKLVALTRRTAMDLAGLSRDADLALARHIYDLHLMRDLVDHDEVAQMAKEIAAADADEFRNQYPAYHADIAGETRKALDGLRTDPIHRARYTEFVAAMVYGEKAEFDDALATVTAMTQRWTDA